MNRQIIFYDGVCALCNWFVTIVLWADTKGTFYFISQQADNAPPLLEKYGYTLPPLESVVVLDEKSGQIYVKSQAVLAVAKQLGGLYSLLGIFSFIPTRFADYLYDIIAKNRYQIFGVYEACPLPKAKDRARFL